MFLSLQIGFSFVKAAVALAILERTSGLEPSSETSALKVLEACTVPRFCPFTLISLMLLFALFVVSLVFSALISIFYPCAGFVKTFNPGFLFLLFLSLSIYAIGKLQIGNFLLPMLAFLPCSSRASDMIRLRKMLMRG